MIKQRYHSGTGTDSDLGFVLLEIANILTRVHLQALALTVNIT